MAKKNSIFYAVVIGDGEKYSNIKEQASYLNNLLGEEKIFIMQYNYDDNEYSSLYYGIVKTKNYVIASISKPITIRPNNTIYFDDIEGARS